MEVVIGFCDLDEAIDNKVVPFGGYAVGCFLIGSGGYASTQPRLYHVHIGTLHLIHVTFLLFFHMVDKHVLFNLQIVKHLLFVEHNSVFVAR